MFRYLPEQASKAAPSVDWLHNLITDLSVFFTVAIVGAMIYYAIKYRKRNNQDHETPRIEGNNLLEIIWTVVPTIISIYIAYYGIAIYYEMHEGEENAVVINATGKKWLWEFEYENGKKTIGEIVVPVGKPIKVVLTSQDVLHSFFVPAMRVKRDAVPGQFTATVFTPVKVGDYHVFCTEYCGTRHSAMLANLKVVPEAEYDRWVTDRTDDLAKLTMSPVKLGAKLYKEKACISCHSLDGSAIVGPSFLKVYDSERKFVDGKSVKADEEYLRESILYPNAKIVQGYSANQMPVFEGQLSDDELKALIAFIRAQDGSAPLPEEDAGPAIDLATLTPEERGKYLYETKACIGCHSLDGSKMVGPSFKGALGRTVKLQDGSEVIADDDYVIESILYPNAKIVEGYMPAMPSYEGQLSEDDIADIIAFMKSVN